MNTNETNNVVTSTTEEIELSDDPYENLQTAKELLKDRLVGSSPSEISESILLLKNKFDLSYQHTNVLKQFAKEQKTSKQTASAFTSTSEGVTFDDVIIIQEPTKIIGISDNLDIDLNDSSRNHFTHYRLQTGNKILYPSHGEMLTRTGIIGLISQGMMATEGDSKLISSYLLLEMQRAQKECKRFGVALQPGWKRDKSIFVSGNTAHSEKGKQPVNLLDKHSQEMYDSKGTLEEWKHPSLLKWIDYDTARFCCYVAVSGIISSFLGLPNIVTSIVGLTSGGKTTITMSAGSMIGRVHDGKYIVRSASITQTAAEKVSQSINGHFLVLDETKTSKDYEPLVYMLANGRARGRAPNSMLEESEGFTASYIFTGESELLKETVAQGANGRLITLTNKILRTPENAELAKDIESIVQQHYGHVKELFIKKVMENKHNLQKRYRELAAEFRDKDKDIGTRIGDSIACVCLAGQLLEEVFADIGVPAKDCKSLCSNVMKENIESDQKKEYWLRGLEIVFNEVSTWQHKTVMKTVNEGEKVLRVLEDTETLLFNNKIGGKEGFLHVYIAVAAFSKICQDHNLNKNELLKVWKEKEITQTDGSRYDKSAKIEGQSIRCVSLNKHDLRFKLNIDI